MNTKKLLVFACLFIGSSLVNAQNSIFPLLNIKTSYGGHYIAAQVKANYNYLGKDVLVADKLYYYKGLTRMGEYTTKHGQYISFAYAGNLIPVLDWERQWNKCITQTQFAFWPGGLDGYELCSFVMGNNRLYLVKLESDEILAEFETVNNPTAETYAFLTVFANEDIEQKDWIVISGRNCFKFYDAIPFSPESSIKNVKSYENKPITYYDVSGKKIDSPKTGLNIILAGDSLKKVIVK